MLLSDMEKAVSRIHKAIENSEKILVYGDYDADGVTSTTILIKTLESLGAKSVGIFRIDLQKDMVQVKGHFEMLMMKTLL